MKETKLPEENKSVSEFVQNLKEDAKEILSDKPTTRRKILSGGAVAAAVFGSEAYGQIRTASQASVNNASVQEFLSSNRATLTRVDADVLPGPSTCLSQVGTPSNVHKLLQKAAFGWSKTEEANVTAMGGYDAWLNQQVDPYNWQPYLDFEDDLENVYGYDAIHDPPGGPNICGGDTTLADSIERANQWRKAQVVRACLSPAPLLELMMIFWGDHFNENINEPTTDLRYLPMERWNNVRPLAFGWFKDLVLSVATGPAMLRYLNGFENVVGSVNENFCRELMELHTLGVGEGTGNCYDEQTIKDLSPALTGWQVTVPTTHGSGPNCGVVYFDPALHDTSQKTVIFPQCPDNVTRTLNIPSGQGINEIDIVVDFLTNPDPMKLGQFTAEFLATKLTQWLFSYKPPQSVIDAAVDAYVNNWGSPTQIAEMVKTILDKSRIQCAGVLIKRPMQRLASIIRATDGAVTDPGTENQSGFLIGGYLQRAGQVPGNFPSPDGQPHGKTEWLELLKSIWELAARISFNDYPSSANAESFIASVPDTTVLDALNTVDTCLFDGFMSNNDRNAILTHFAGVAEPLLDTKKRELIALALASPSFQTH
ncbi:MAG: DUF1800 domain-containing protein [Phycisphaerales bacterium]|nr:DUF1800 domain-containing protein [Phycisphaerales bacterium]